MQQTAGVKSWCQRGASLLFLVLVIREEKNAEAEAAATFFKYLIGPSWHVAASVHVHKLSQSLGLHLKLKFHGTLLHRVCIMNMELETQSLKTVANFCLLLCNEVKLVFLLFFF